MSEKRNDLQGLRGIAILLVLVFHLKPHFYPLGFIGVDMFFVLSGYLMTMILSKKPICTDVILDFYTRRFKRIVPLFTVILSMVYIVSWFYLLSEDRLQLLTDLKWSLTFTSNMQPLFEIKDYWDQVTSYRLLVHCWSLGAEIQFYVIAPFVVGYCREKKWNFVLYLSFFCSICFQIFAPPKMSYGLLPSRVWQFLCGTVAYEMERWFKLTCQSNSDDKEKLLHTSIRKTNANATLSFTVFRELLAIALIILVLLNPSFMNETIMRIVGTLLTTAYIFTSSFSRFSFLSMRLLVYIGDISYTLYLVHWPTIVLYKYYYSLEDLNITGISWCLFIMFALSIFVHHTLEDHLLRSSLTYGFKLFCWCIFFILVTSAYYETDIPMLLRDSNSNSGSDVVQQAIAYNKKILGQVQGFEKDINNPERTYIWLPCKRDFEPDRWTNWTIRPEMRCIAQGNGTLNVMVMGNSIAYRAFPKIHEVFKGRYKTLRLYSKGMYPGIYSSPKTPLSVEFEKAVSTVVERMKPDVIFIMYTLAMFSESTGELRSPLNDLKTDIGLNNLQRNFDFYSKHTRRIVLDLPYYTRSKLEGLKEVIKRLKFGKPLDDLKVTKKDFDKQLHWEHERLRKINCSKCIINDINEDLFPDDTFYFYDRKTFYSYYHDGVHLTHAGLDLLTDKYRNVVDKVIKDLACSFSFPFVNSKYWLKKIGFHKQEENVVSLVSLSYRFLAPRVLEKCKKFIDLNFETLDKIDLLVVVFQYDMNELKKKVADFIKIEVPVGPVRKCKDCSVQHGMQYCNKCDESSMVPFNSFIINKTSYAVKNKDRILALPADIKDFLLNIFLTCE